MEAAATRETLWRGQREVDQPDAGDGQAGHHGESDGPVLLKKPDNAGGGKGPWFKTTQEAERDRTLGNLISPEDKVQKLQAALHAKAKAEPGFRFYQLYDKVYRQDVLAIAYQRCKSNGGVAGVDGQCFEDIKAYGEERWLGDWRNG